MQKPSNAKGTRDFLPQQMAKRNLIFDTIKSTFQKYAYQCIETPAVERIDTLTGKYGAEGDKLIFKILNSGDFKAKADLNADTTVLSKQIAEKALRYDLTVPFARMVVQHQNDITFPFKRYQIQPVWRADRPQKGRYREFYQCDADVVGSDSLVNEVEMIQMYDEVLSQLEIENTIHINNRKILEGIAHFIGMPDHLISLSVAIDKLDKMPWEKVEAELLRNGFSQKSIGDLLPFLNFEGDWKSTIKMLENKLGDIEVATKGIEELTYVLATIDNVGLAKSKLNLNIKLARGLSYYTGCIFEVTTDMIKIGSICGGGRYDNLTGVFGLKNISGVGISFGADRIYDVMEEAQLWPADLEGDLDYLFINFGEASVNEAFLLAKSLRSKGLNVDIYPDAAKIKKQMKYANDKSAQYVIMLGEEELKNEIVTLKNMRSGEEAKLSRSSFLEDLS